MLQKQRAMNLIVRCFLFQEPLKAFLDVISIWNSKTRFVKFSF